MDEILFRELAMLNIELAIMKGVLYEHSNSWIKNKAKALGNCN